METLISNDWQAAATWLRAGEVVGIPTETVYGLAGNALNADAVLRIFEVKNRPFFDPLILHTHSVAAISAFVTEIPPQAQQLFDAFSPGPLTILLPKRDLVPDLVTAGLPRVAVRIPNHPLTLDLLRNLDFPVAAPSANPFGYISPTTAQHVAAQLGNKIPMILDGGACGVGVESTIIGFENGQSYVYRLGGLAVEALENVLGKVELRLNQSSNPAAPGQLKSHYAPRKPFFVTHDVEAEIKKIIDNQMVKNIENVAIINFNNHSPSILPQHQIVLSQAGNLHEAAKHLFAAMRQLDALPDVEMIVAQWLPNISLGRALNDRLRRAATPTHD